MTEEIKSNFFAEFDTETLSENGSWLHFKHPKTKQLSYVDKTKTKPFRMKFKGPDSDDFQNFIRKSRSSEKKTEIHEDRISDAKLFCKMLLDWENVPGDNGKIINDLDKNYAMKLFVEHKDLRVQILAFILAQDNFLLDPLEA